MKKALILAPLALLAIPFATVSASAQTVVINPGHGMHRGAYAPGMHRGAYGPGMRRGWYKAPPARVVVRRTYGVAPVRQVTRVTTRTNRAGMTTTRRVMRTY